jgi:WD40 repeat protein
VATGGEDGTVQLWDPTGNSLRVVLPGSGQPITQVTYSPDGHHLAAVDLSGSVLVWNLLNHTEPKQLRLPQKQVSEVAFSPDSTRLAAAVGLDDSLWIWYMLDTEYSDHIPTDLLTPYQGGLRDVAWSPDGHHVAAATQSNTVLLWDLRTNTGPTMLRGRQKPIWALTFSPDGIHLASGSNDGTVRIWDITTRTADPIVFRGHQGTGGNMTFSPDGHRIVTSGNNATVTIWKIDSISEPLTLEGFRASVQAIAPLGDDRYVTAHDDGTIRVWRCPACGPITEVLTTAKQHITRQLTPDERQAYLPIP